MIEKIKKSLWLVFFIQLNICALEIRQPFPSEIKEVSELYHKSWHDTFDALSPKSLVLQRTRDNCFTQWQEYYNKVAKYSIHLKERLETHNSGGSVHTATFRPWEIVLNICFNNQSQAIKFEKYLKS